MDPGTGDSCQQQFSGDVWGCGIEGRRAGQVSFICLSVPICIMDCTTCKAVKARISSPSPTHQLSLLSSSQGKPLPLPAALCHLRRICRRRRPVVHAKRHQLPPPPDTLPLQRKASSRRARAMGPTWKPRGEGGGEDLPAVSSRPPREHSGGGISCSVLSFCKKRWMWGEKEMRPVGSLCPGGQGKPRGRRAWVGHRG